MKVIVVKGSGAGSEFRLYDGINMLGREASNRIRLLDPRVSRRHCRIRKVGQSLFLFDLGTKNGTLVNGDSASERELKIGDQIKVGSTILKIVDEDYVVEKAVEQSGPTSFFRHITMAIFGRRQKQEAGAIDKEFAKFILRGRKPLWRPTVDIDPPEGRQETAVSHSDPD